MVEHTGSIEAPQFANTICLAVCATDWGALVRPYAKAECVLGKTQSTARKLSADEPQLNSAQAARLQQRRFEFTEKRAVQRTQWETVSGPGTGRFGFVEHDPARVVPAVFPTKTATCKCCGSPGRRRSNAFGGRKPDNEPRLRAHPDAPPERQPLWFRCPETWRRRGWTIDGYDRRARVDSIRDLRRVYYSAATSAPFPTGAVLTREMFIAELRHAYALLWPWPSGRNETEAGVLDYTILRLLDWSPDAAPATTLAEAFNAAGWSRARYARAFEDRQHFDNWLRKETRFYAKSLGRCRTVIPYMHDDIPVQFKDGRVALLGEKIKTSARTIFKDERCLTEPTIDIWDAIAEVKPVDKGERYDGLPSRASGRAKRRGRRPRPGPVARIFGGDVDGRQTLAERYGENIPQWQLKMVDRALDDMEQERLRDAAIPRKFAGRYNDDAPSGFARDDIGDSSGAASRTASGTRKARGAAAARAIVEQVHHEIAFHEWLNTLDVEDDYETIRLLALTLHHWGSGQPHEDLARVAGIDPEVERGRLALAFEGLRRALGYEPTSRRKVEAGIKRLAIRAETLEHIATTMTFEAAVLVPTKNGGRPRKLDAKVAAERMRYAARILSIMEILYTRLLLVLDGAICAPKPLPLQPLVEAIANVVALTPVRPPSTKRYEVSIWEVIDALTEVGLLRDRELCARPGGAARAAVALSWWTAEATVGFGAGNGRLSTALNRLLQEYINREPRPRALAKPVQPLRPTPPRWRHIEDVRRLSWRRSNWHALEIGVARNGASDRPSVHVIHRRADVHADPVAAARFLGVDP